MNMLTVDESFEVSEYSIVKKIRMIARPTYMCNPTFLTMQDIEKFHVIFPMYGSSLAI